MLITGGSGGLGVVVTAAAARAGARVTVPVLTEEDGERLLAQLGPDAGAVRTVVADLRTEAEVERVMDAMPRIDALVHLVGGFAMGPIIHISVDDFVSQFELNVLTTFVTAKQALLRMCATGYGRIVTVASRVALEPEPDKAAYATAKAAVLALTRAIAVETRGTDITANCVLPSTIDTPANRAAMGDAAAHTWVKPERLARTILFLASEPAGDLRGTAVQVYANA